ncbi:MAG: hypothetical protein B5M51_07755 [Anaerolinea sp. 4484_236]|nr:MAG: hypothetical protein B5M51_07755 [Anaerolinea sp. 4484_236]
MTEWLDRRLQGSKWGDKVATKLAQANLKLRPAEYLALMVILAFGAGFVAWFFGQKSPVSAGIGVIIGLMIPSIYVKRQRGARLKAFSDQLPDMLNLVVNGLRAGYSTIQALEAVSQELPPPISEEFHRVVQEMQLGLPMEAALENLHRRIPSDDLDLINTAINVQREVGGNLAEILDTISYTIRERIRIKGEIKVLVSQVMYSGRFLSALPFILAAILWFINQEYMMQFFEPRNLICGLIMLGIAGVLVGIGYFIMTRIADIEV